MISRLQRHRTSNDWWQEGGVYDSANHSSCFQNHEVMSFCYSFHDDGYSASYIFSGYTGHESLQRFGHINMNVSVKPNEQSEACFDFAMARKRRASLNARLYDPMVSRFLSPDPYVQMPDNTQNFNRYSYCLNNPLRYTDESGEFIETLLIGIGMGALIGSGTSALSYSAFALINGNWNSGDFWNAVCMGAVGGAIGGAFGAIGSSTALGTLGNSIGYNFLSGAVNMAATNAIFGVDIDGSSILPLIGSSVVGSLFPSFKGVNGGWFANTMAEIGYNTLKGASMGLAAGVIEAGIQQDADRLWTNTFGGAISGASRTVAMDIVFGFPYYYTDNLGFSGSIRSGGIASLLTLDGNGITLGRMSFVNSINDDRTVYHEAFHQAQINQNGWANFYGQIIWEYIKYLPECGLDGFRHPKGTLEYAVYKATGDKAHYNYHTRNGDKY